MTDQQITEIPLAESFEAVHGEATPLEVGRDAEAVIDEAIGIIDGALTTLFERELMSAGEVADLLLDMRTVLAEHSRS